MKKFDLEAALNGEPVKLRNGRKAVVQLDLTEVGANLLTEYPLRGYVLEKEGIDPTCWTKEGKYIFDKGDHINDIVEMWEEPRISIEDLPKPFKPATQEQYFTITSKYKYDPLCIEETTYFSSPIDNNLINQGNAFRTREHAQKWLDFMKSMME